MIKAIGEKLGPGLLYAATAVGVSHLVSSTQAGGQYGLVMAFFVVAICLIKYPAFLFGARYAAATGETLIDGYAKLGKWILYLFFVIHLFGFTVAASGVSITAAALLKSIFNLQLSDPLLASILVAICFCFLVIGRYSALESISKILVLIFSLLVAIAALIATLGTNTESTTNASIYPPLQFDTITILFLISIAGWMPSGMGGAVSISVWIKAKSERLGRRIPIKEAVFDFHLGYAITIFTAICFVILGTKIMYSQGIAVAQSSTSFGNQLFSLFTETLGTWAYFIIAVTATAAILSTLLALLDLVPRISTAIASQIAPMSSNKISKRRIYSVFIVVEMVLISIFLSFVYNDTFSQFMAMVISMGFLISAPIAYLNHRVMFAPWVPAIAQPSTFIRVWSWFTIAILTIITAVYIYLTLLPRILS